MNKRLIRIHADVPEWTTVGHGPTLSVLKPRQLQQYLYLGPPQQGIQDVIKALSECTRAIVRCGISRMDFQRFRRQPAKEQNSVYLKEKGKRHKWFLLTRHVVCTFPPFTWLCEKNPSMKSVDWHTRHMASQRNLCSVISTSIEALRVPKVSSSVHQLRQVSVAEEYRAELARKLRGTHSLVDDDCLEDDWRRNTTDPQLRPRFFDADPNSADAAKRWNHWFRTFETYLKTLESSKPDKLETLIHFVDPLVYDHIADHTDYKSTIDTLRKLYTSKTLLILENLDSVLTRSRTHSKRLIFVLQTYKQENGQDIDQFVRKLKSLAKDCEFKSVSATEYQDECVRDAIINGLASTSIREKLLAQSELTLDQAYQLARSLELAHKQSQSYVSNEPISCSTIPPISQNPELRVDPTTAAVNPFKHVISGV
ncbi:hypothetical protein CLF_100578 [Clonorchis sinensis]|uniref:Uncharacterized protein n=1 Tax=Clonorchis sinensis TaxID=79923 RepID=G7Y3S4_CLOSI|nr:hypothetical protein CLF_100578 [Clonorchis sinensis]